MVTGANGQLGNSLRRELEADSSIEAIYTDANTLDITDYGTLNRFLKTIRWIWS